MAKIFISYDRASQDVVERLVQDLKDDDHETWFDQRLTGGQIWWDNILSEIRECEVFVAALTPDSLESQACRRELKYAFDLRKPLLPVRLSDKVQSKFLPHDLGERQFVDYIRQDKVDLKNLQRAIKALPKAPPLSGPLPEPPAVPLSYLSTLREQIETESRLGDKDQFALVFQLRRHFRDGRPAEEINELLQRLRKRDDLLAAVSRDIEELQGDINREQRGSVSNKEHTGSNDKQEDRRQDQVHEAGPEYGTERLLKLDSSSAVAECGGLMERVLNKAECWVFEIDPDNNFVIELDASAATPTIMAKARLVDTLNLKKLVELRKLGWTTDYAIEAKQVFFRMALALTFTVAAIIFIYVTATGSLGQSLALVALYGLAAAVLSSRGVRKFSSELEARRSWIVTSPKNSLIDAAADFTLAVRRVAPKAKTIVVKRREAGTQA